MKIKAIILSFLFLLTGSGLKIEISTCCEVLSGISLNFKDNGFRDAADCCACVKASKKSSCCHTQSISTVINPVLGLQKVLTISAKQFSNDFAKVESKTGHFNAHILFLNVPFKKFDQREYPVPILIRKRVLQI